MEEYEVSLKDYIDVIKKEKGLIIAIFLIAVVSSAAISVSMPKEYETRTTLLITPTISQELRETTLGEEAETSTLLTTPTLSTETLERLAVTNDLLLEIIDSLNLKANGEKLSVEDLRSKMEPKAELAERARNTIPLPLLTMTVKGSDPGEIKRIAEEWGRLFIERNAELLSTRTAQSYEFILERHKEVNGELKKKEDEKKAYERENPIVSLNTELSVLNAKYNSHLSRLYEKRRALNEGEARLESLEREVGGETSPLEFDKSILTQIALENKVYLSLEDYLVDAKVSVDVLKGEVSYLEGDIENLKKGIDEREARKKEIELTLSRLNREITTLKETYDFLSQRLQEARIAKEEQLGSIRVVEKPIVPQKPSGPSKMLNIAIAGILGLFVGVFVAFFKNYMEE